MRTSYWKASEAPLLLESLCLANGGVWGDDNRIKDEAVLEAFDLADHFGLILNRAVMVDDSEPAQECHVDSHGMLGDSVHGGRNKGRLERDTLRNRRLNSDGGGREAFCC
jgi:hypothetical protein